MNNKLIDLAGEELNVGWKRRNAHWPRHRMAKTLEMGSSTMKLVKMHVCPDCQAEWVSTDGKTMYTLVGYDSPQGHDHDDNCQVRFYKCANRHMHEVVKNADPCPAPNCDWKPRTDCNCMGLENLTEWPKLPGE